MTEKRKINVIIDGRNFTVIGDSSEEYVRMLASYVDEKIKEMTSKNDRLSGSMAATLAALNIADEFYRSYKELETLKNKSKAPMENYSTILNELKEEKAKNEELMNKCNIYKDEVIEMRRQNGLLLKEIDNNKKALEMKEKELKDNQVLIRKLQDKVYANQIELIELRKELEEVLKTYDKEKNLFIKEEV